jgi:DNA-binding PadR family transcriptional regulator
LDPRVRDTLRDFLLGRVTARRSGPLRHVILTLVAIRPMSGYDIMKAVEYLTRGSWRPSPGSIYPLLKKLREEGAVEWREVRIGGRVRKIYVATESGLREIGDLADDPEVRGAVSSIPLDTAHRYDAVSRVLEELEFILEFIEENIDEVRNADLGYTSRLRSILSRIMEILHHG